MNQRVYLDYAATTPVDAAVLECMLPFFKKTSATHLQRIIMASKRRLVSNSARDPGQELERSAA